MKGKAAAIDYFDPSDRVSRRSYCERCEEVDLVTIDGVCETCSSSCGVSAIKRAWLAYRSQRYSAMHPVVKSFAQWHITSFGLECHTPYHYFIKADRLWEMDTYSDGSVSGWEKHMQEKEWCFQDDFARAIKEARIHFQKHRPKVKAAMQAVSKSLSIPAAVQHETEITVQTNSVVRFHQSENGSKSISTNAQTEESFLREVEQALSQRVQSEGEFAPGWLKPICDIVCKLRGYKSEVTEHRVIVAGEWIPSDVVDAMVRVKP